MSSKQRNAKLRLEWERDMAKEPKPTWNSFTKAELIRTIKKLDARQTKLMNMITNRDRELERLRPTITVTRHTDLRNAGGVAMDEEYERVARSAIDAGSGAIAALTQRLRADYETHIARFPWEKK